MPAARQSLSRLICTICGVIVLVVVLLRLVQYIDACQKPIQAYLVLGGNAFREAFSAELAAAHPTAKVLISGGSKDPCLWLIYKKNQAPMQNVFAEHCSQNTFENIVYSMPLLEKMNIRKVSLVTEYAHAERALPIATIVFASHGMAVEFTNVPFQDSRYIKSREEQFALVLASFAWAISSQFYQPQCADFTHLPTVDMDAWYTRGFDCQLQTGVNRYRPPLH